VSNMELLRPDTTDLGRLEKRPSEIIFVRNRMLYARAALNARGLVQFGFRHIRECGDHGSYLRLTTRQMC
jgi:hypothetical protein